jgi:chromosome segregation ATPase
MEKEMFTFIKSFIGIKGREIGREVVDALVELDPESATEAQLKVMENDLDQAGKVIQTIRADLVREQKEAELVRNRYERLLAAAEHLQQQTLDPAQASRRPELEASLDKLVSQLEELRPEVEQEERDVQEVEILLSEAMQAYKVKAEALAKARAGLQRARNDMQRAKLAQERAEQQAERAGLRGTGQGNRLSTAMDAMQRQAETARSKAEAARMKAQALTMAGATGTGEVIALEDAHIAAALAATRHPVAKAGISDRLAALRQTPSGLALTDERRKE